MGWFSPIKGSYPGLGQIDKTLPVATGESNKLIERGMIVEVAGDNTFKVAGVSGAAYKPAMLYVSLQDYKDAQAGMAGTTAFDANVPSITEGNITIPGVTAGVPTITGLALSMEGEYETSMFDTTSITASTPIGTGLTVSNGKFCVDTTASNDDDVVAYLTEKPSSRWVNNETAKQQGSQVTRQGKSVSVIRFRTK